MRVTAKALALSLLPIPVPGKGQVLVKNEVAGLNFIDTYQRSGLYKLKYPHTLGVEGAGLIVGFGEGVDKNTFNSKRVVYYGSGSCAEYTVVPASQVLEYPENIKPEIAIALITQGLTSEYLTTSTYPLGPGKTALIHAASGGTGQLLVQVAKILGARVIGTSSSSKMHIGLSCGADEMIPYDQKSNKEIVDKVKSLTDGKGVDVVYDGVGKRTYEISLDCLRVRGVCVLFGNASGPVPPIDPLVLSAKGSLYLTRPTLYHYIGTRDELVSRANNLFRWVNSGKLKVTIDKVVNLDEISKAHEYIESGKTTGKVVFKINSRSSF